MLSKAIALSASEQQQGIQKENTPVCYNIFIMGKNGEQVSLAVEGDPGGKKVKLDEKESKVMTDLKENDKKRTSKLI